MLRHLFQILILVFLLAPGQYAQAALSPESQQLQEEDAVRESSALRGKLIRSIFMYEENETRYYQVEADCTYQFIVNYPLNWLVFFGWVGPQKFNVKMVGEPDCQDVLGAQRHEGDLRATLFEAISEIYDVPIAKIVPNMSLYHIPTGEEYPSMDFRIFALRAHLEERAACQIEIDRFANIRTVGHLLMLAEQSCGQPR